MFFFFNDTATTEIYTLSLHDALPISGRPGERPVVARRHARSAHPGLAGERALPAQRRREPGDRKSTRLNSSHQIISYPVFCFKKKKKKPTDSPTTPHHHSRTPPQPHQ